MKTSKNLLLVVWALLTVVAVGVAWQQYWKAARLQAMLAGGGFVELQNKLAATEQRNRSLELEAEARSAAATEAATNPAPAASTRGNGPGFGRGGRGDMAAMMDRPEMVRLRTLQQRAALDTRFAPLFKSLNLAPEKIGQLKTLLAERESTMQDVMMSAREQGLDPRSDPAAFRKLVATAQTESDTALKTLLGDDAYAQYEQYSQTQPQRATVEQLRASLSYTSDPLSDAQATQLTQILAATAPTAADGAPVGPPPDGGGRGPGGPGGPGGGGVAVAPITSEAVVQAQAVLTTTQLAALQQMQTLQQAQQQAMQNFRAAVPQNGDTATPTAGGTTSRRGPG